MKTTEAQRHRGFTEIYAPNVRVIRPYGSTWQRHINPPAMLAGLWTQRHLIGQLLGRDVRLRFQGSYLGWCWALLIPVLMLAVYTFVFHFVFKVRWGPATEGSPIESALILFCGWSVFHALAESVTRSPTLIRSHPNYVKKVVFPLEVLPVVSVAAAAVQLFLSLAIVTLASVFIIRTPGWELAYLLSLVVPFLCLVLGLSWLFAALGTFLPDLGPALAIFVQLWLFVTPVFYPLHAVPESWRGVLSLNPVAVYVDGVRQVVLWGLPPNGPSLIAVSLVSLLVMQVGYLCFMESKKAFADVV